MKRIQAAAVDKLAEARALVTGVHVLDAAGQYERSLAERELVTNACFLKVFITLEEFFEASFGHYATGKMSTAKWRPSKYARPPSLNHAHEMFIGFQRFMDWSTPEKVVKLARLYFASGEPFEVPVNAAFGHLQSMKTVRNSTAHVSRTTQAALDALYTRWTGVPTSNVTAYRMLLATNPVPADTFYGVSESTVTAIVNQVANYT